MRLFSICSGLGDYTKMPFKACILQRCATKKAVLDHFTSLHQLAIKGPVPSVSERSQTKKGIGLSDQKVQSQDNAE